MEPIFETNVAGFKAKVYPDRVTYKFIFFNELIIPIKQIASVEVAMPGVQQVTVETTGGKRYKMVIRLRDKESFRNAILKSL